MADLILPEVIDQVLREVYGSAAKATTASQQQSLAAPAATVVTGSPAQQAAVVAGSAGLAALGPAAAGAGMAAMGPAVARAMAMLAALPLKLALITRIISLLYAAAFLAGAREAADAAGGTVPTWMAAVPPEPETGWSPKAATEALNLAQGGLADLLRDRGIWIKEMTTTQVNRVGEAIRESVENGRPLSEARAAIDAIVHDSARALLIAETEYARAQTVAVRETYIRNHVPMVQWLHQEDACPRCMDNAAVSPIPVTQRWPQGDVPVHPHCRCAEAPYYPPRSH